MAERAGKTTSAEINSEPTRFIARTMMTAIKTASIRLYSSVRIPAARAKLSSNVIANTLLYKNANTSRTSADKITHRYTSSFLSVKIDVEPKSVLHTSPERFEDVAKTFITR